MVDPISLLLLKATVALGRRRALSARAPPRRPAPPDPRYLSAHLRRDIGLPPAPPPRHVPPMC